MDGQASMEPMKVKPTDKKYFCFGCGEKGDAIDFVAKYYNRSPREAAMQIADEFGIIYDSSVRSPPNSNRRRRRRMGSYQSSGRVRKR